jgi:hypothetical protein
LVISVLGASSIAAGVAFQPKHVQVIDSDVSNVVNSNAQTLDQHIDLVADAEHSGHIKIGTGLQMNDGTASVKIANDLKTQDAGTALSAAMGQKLDSEIKGLGGVNVQLQVFDAPSKSGFYYTSSFYIPSSTTVELKNVNVFGADGNFYADFKQSRYGNYLSFYTDNKNLAGKGCTFNMLISE